MQVIMKFILLVMFTTYYSVSYSQPFKTEQEWKTYFLSNILTLKEYEGIYQVTQEELHKDAYNTVYSVGTSPELGGKHHYLLYRNGKYYDYFEGALEPGQCYTPTSNSNIFIIGCEEGSIINESRANFEDGSTMNYSFPWSKFPKSNFLISMKFNYLKIFPSKDDIESAIKSNLQSNRISSGTGFAVSSNGYIVTNYHVVEGAKNISVKGVNGDFNKTYTAQVITSDKNNDLAIIQITDNSFINLGNIPYVIKHTSSSVGENVFVLGFPLRSTMGDEIKLTNGIISSKTGYTGDVTSYQITAPLQPGNSGGPVFDIQGNLIGVASAKHSDAENVSYAIKTSYVINLIDVDIEKITLQGTNILAGKSLVSQVEAVKKFVYIIEATQF